MRKIVLTLIASVFTITAQSQDKPLKFGVKAGVNFASLTGDVGDTKMKVGFHAGVLAEYFFTEKFSIQPEILYSLQGAKFDLADGGDINDAEQKLAYINIPIIVKYNNLGAKGLSLGVGPQVGILTSAKFEYEDFLGNTAEEDIKDSRKPVDFGLVFNLEYDFDMGLFLQGRYNLGLSTIDDTESDSKVKQSVLSVSMGYKF